MHGRPNHTTTDHGIPRYWANTLGNKSDFPVDVVTGIWLDIREASRLYKLSPMWSTTLADLIYKDAQAAPRPIYNDIVQPFLDKNGLMMCSLCFCGFQSKDKYEEHASLHSRGSPFFAECCGRGFVIQNPMREHYATGCSGSLKSSILIHDKFERILLDNETVEPESSPGSGLDFHCWSLVLCSVRYSSDSSSSRHSPSDFHALHTSIRRSFFHCFKPTVDIWARIPFKDSHRSSRMPYTAHAQVSGLERDKNIERPPGSLGLKY